MADMLVKLYDLPSVPTPASPDICVRRALGPEKQQVVAWVARFFSQGWADEGDLAFTRQPVACFIAHTERSIVGFCAYDATARGLLGPIGVIENMRGRGIGRCLLLTALKDMAAQGYAYAVVGWAGPEAFFARTARAVPIAGSDPGIYRNLLSSEGPS